MFLKYLTVVVFLLAARRVHREALGGILHHFVGYFAACDFLESVYPAISHAIGELLFLAPCNALGEHVFKRLAQDVFLHFSITRPS